MFSLRRVCVFCGSSSGARPAYLESAAALGRAIARRGLGLVYGGGSVGLMRRVADAAAEAGGEVVGVIPDALVAKEVAHLGLEDLRIVGSMHERKALMADLADAFIALPGGFGTLEELCEVLTWSQLGLHGRPKPSGLLNVEGYFNGLLAFLDHTVEERFVHPVHRRLVLAETDPERLLDALAAYEAPVVEKWIERDET